MTCGLKEPGNTVGKPQGYVFGRPSNYNIKQIAEDLLIWAEKDDSINLNKFCAKHDPKINPRKLSEWAKKDDDFREAYETAKAFLGFRREEWLNSESLHVKGYDLNAKTYDFFMEEKEIEKEKRLAAYSQQANTKTPQSIVIQVSNDGLASGINISTTPLSNTDNQSIK